MIRLIRLVKKIVLISFGLGICAMFISVPFIGKSSSVALGVGVAIISAITFLIKPKLLGTLYKDPDDQE